MLATVVEFQVVVVDGEGIPVPGLEIGARYHYRNSPSTWDCATTDGDGVARFTDEHAEMPFEVALFVGDEQCGTYPLTNHAHLTLEM